MTTYPDDALQPVNSHCYYVQGIAKTRSLGVTNTVCAKPPVRPAAASGASAIPQGALVNITWTDNSVNESGFRIEVAGSVTGDWAASGGVGPDITTAQRSAAVEVEVCYHVVAYNEFGDAAPSSPACTTPLAAPSLSASGESQLDREIKLTWSDNSTEESYEISRSISGGAWQVLTSLSANSTEYLDRDLSLATEYSYRVRAMKGAGFSDYSNVAIATAINGRPRPPGNVYTYVFASDAVEVYWDTPQGYWDGSSSITGWRVERSTFPFTSWASVATTTNYWYDDYGLTPDQTVCYRVIALSKDAYGESDPSSPGDYSCATPPSDYYDGGYGGNALTAAAGFGRLLNRPTPLLNFGPPKAAVSRAGVVKASNRGDTPGTKRIGRTR